MAATLREALGVDQEIAATRRKDLYRYVQKGKMTPVDAADEIGLSVPEFLGAMQGAGYTLPAMSAAS